MAVDADAVFAEWSLADDGVYERSSARVVIVDGDERVLLMRAGHGEDIRWFTIGGGIAEGEHPLAAAVREAYEETGLRLAPSDLVGPICRRKPTFTFLGRTCRQDELIYLARVPAGTVVDTAGWTAVERWAVDGVHWWPLAELRATTAILYPPDLGERVATVLRHGWDGSIPVTD